MRPPRLLPTIVCGLVLASFARADHVTAYQHVANGSFESGLSSWGVSAGITPSIVADGATDGAAALSVPAGARARIGQPLTGALGASDYTFSYAARTPSGAGMGKVVALIESASASTTIIGTNDDVTGEATFAHAFNLTMAMDATLTLTLTAPPNGALIIDDIRIDGVAPVTMTPTATSTPLAPASTTTPLPVATATAPTPTPTAPAGASPIGPSLRNGGFEYLGDDGVPIAWEQYGGTLSSSSRANRGARAARIESATDSTKWLHQAVTVNGGATYELRALVLHDDPAVARALLRVSWYASDDASGSNIGSDDSKETLDTPNAGYRSLATGPITAPPDARSARVRVLLAPASAAPAAILIDDATWGAATPLAATPVAQATQPAAGGRAAAEPTAPRGATSPRSRGTSGTASGVVVATGTRPTGARIVINEVLYDATGEGTDADGEWVELYNAGDAATDLAGWRIADGVAADELPPYVLEPGAYVVVTASDSIAQIRPELRGRTTVIDGRIGNGLGNAGDTLLLVASDGGWIDAVSWGDDASALDPAVGDVPAGHSIERSPAGADTGRASDFVDNASPSPGGPIGAASPQRTQGDARPRVEILAGEGSALAWLPWAIAAASLAALAGVVSWRAFDVVRHRVRP